MAKVTPLLDEMRRAAGQLTTDCLARQDELNKAYAEVDDLQRKYDELENQ